VSTRRARGELIEDARILHHHETVAPEPLDNRTLLRGEPAARRLYLPPGTLEPRA